MKHKKRLEKYLHNSYLDLEEYDEFADMCNPRNMGRRHVNSQEWDDYILEAQLLWVEELAIMEPEPPPKRGRTRTRVHPPAGKRKKRKLELQSASWVAMYIAS